MDYEYLKDGSDDSDFEDEIKNLEEQEEKEEDLDEDETQEHYLDLINKKLKNGEIDDYSYALDHILIKYKRMLMFRRFNLSNPEISMKIEKLREIRKMTEDDYIKDKINEADYSKRYYHLIEIEIELLESYEEFTDKTKKEEPELPLTFEEKIDNLMTAEQKYYQSIAKENGIDWPKKPKKFKKIEEMLEYRLLLKNAEHKVFKYMPSYNMLTLSYNEKDQPVYKEDISGKLLMKKLKDEYKTDKQESQVTMTSLDNIEQLKLKELLKENFDRDKLLNCISYNTSNLNLTYIEKLKLNTVPVIKFRTQPETFNKVKDILKEDAKYYRIPENIINKNFSHTFNDPISETNFKKLPRTFNPVTEVKVQNYTLPKFLDETDETKLDKLYPKLHKIKEPSFLLNIKHPIKKNLKLNQTKYLEKGSVISYSLKKEYFGKKISIGDLNSKYFDIIKPISDELYNDLVKNKTTNTDKTEIVKIWELHVPVKGFSEKLIKRYNNFENYLEDLLNILSENLIELESEGYFQSADILHSKIKKIKEFLKSGNDIEYGINQQLSITRRIIDTDYIIEQRKAGLNNLLEYILQFYPDNTEFVENLEGKLYEHDNIKYVDNVQRVLFIFKEFDDSLKDYIEGKLSFIKLINIELPTTLPPDDLKDMYVDINKTFKYLYNWRPQCDLYNKYKDELDSINENYMKFKLNNSKLNELEINEIFIQLHDCKKWESIILELAEIKIDKGKNPICEMVKYLKKNRNKLLSRRIYTVAYINNRIKLRNDLKQLLSNCTLLKSKINIDILANTIESIIYEYSIYPTDYDKYTMLITSSINMICEMITTESFIPQITEFIIKEGDPLTMNIERVNQIVFSDGIEPQLYKEFLTSIREEELKAYRAGLISQQNGAPNKWRTKLIKIINQQIEINKDKKKLFMHEVANNTYIPPVLTNIIPKIRTQNGFYTPNYVIISEGNYIYGGNYPPFKSTINGNNNYKESDLYDLALILNVNYEDNIELYDLYKLCMLRLEDYSTENKEVYPTDTIMIYNPVFLEKKQYKSFVNYIYRPRIGVKEPGEVYIVYPDTYSVQYAVPFKFNSNGLPVYNKKFKEPDIKQYYYIEGPGEFEYSDNPNDFIFSSFYILVEYLDSYGKSKKFREGVNSKFIKKSPKQIFDACNRFTTEIDCNHINSYGLNKLKCIYIKNKCVTMDIRNNMELIKRNMDIDIDKIKFYKLNNSGKKVIDYIKHKQLQNALKQAMEYINKLIFIQKINEKQIEAEAQNQKQKLIQYINELNKVNLKHIQLKTILEDTEFSNQTQSIVEEFPDILGTTYKEPKKEIDTTQINDEKTLKLPFIRYKHISVSTAFYKDKSRLIIGKEYLINDKTVSVLTNEFSKITNGSLINYLNFNGQIYERDKITLKTANKQMVTEELPVQISQSNFNFLMNPPINFEYKLIVKNYIIKDTEIICQSKIEKTNKIALDILFKEYINHYSLSLDNLNLISNSEYKINNQIIYNYFGELLYNTYTLDHNNFLQSLELFNASKEAKITALKYNINLDALTLKINGEITKQNVLDEYYRLLPKITSISDNIINQLKHFTLTTKDKKGLEIAIKKAEKYQKTNFNDTIDELISIAKLKLVELTKKDTEKEKEQKPKVKTPEIELEEKPQNIYLINRKKKKSS